jgi:RNase H-fold protein (predicted Holliday junction resolvase)
MDKTVLAIDPGSSKCGMALVRRDAQGKLNLLWRAITPTEDLISKVHEAFAVEAFSLIIIGSGTSSKGAIKEIREELPGMGLLAVDEKDSSEKARERYWVYNPRRGIRRLYPASMQEPPEPVDDFAALILAERVLLP